MSKREICQEVEGMVPAFVLGALDSDERAYVEQHLEACPGCQQLVAEYRQISDGLLHLAPTTAAPPGLWANIEAALEPANQPNALDRLMAPFRHRSEIGKLAVGLAGAGVVLMNILLLGRIDVLRQGQQQLQAQVDRNQTAMAVLTYPTSQAVDFQNEAIFGTLVFDPGRPIAVLYAWGLEPLAADQTYQAWLVDDGGSRVSAGTFEPEVGNQFSVVLLRGPHALEDFISLGVTIEPAGGSAGPTSDPVLNVEL